MIQATFSSGANIDNFIYLRLTDVGSATNSIRPLISIKSQQTEKELNFMASLVTITNENRYTEMKYTIGTTDLPLLGLLILGNTDYPFGFYDVTIYQNSSNSNLDPTGLTTTLYTGLLNLRSLVDTTQYKQYTINDSDTDSVYITI
jgi:hypothetical protein|tara:strand:- start:29 stop:466 length:438 start_codon:yes stop_codon:yes gene_type:complete